MDLNRKIDFAIKLLRSIPQDGPIELSYSGGKDSDVILELAKMSGIKFEAIYKNTTIDPPGTVRHCRDMGVRIVQPKISFLKLVEKKGFPSRFTRFCCEVLKEYKIYDRAIQGIRKEESTKRAKIYKEPEFCRTYPKGGKVRIYLPILEWTLDDVKNFVEDRKLKLAPTYYDVNGQIDFSRRLGCIGCPLASAQKRREAYLKYPKILRVQIKALERFYELHPDTVGAKMWGGDAYKKMMADLFFPENPKEILQDGLFGWPDAKEYITNYFGL